MGYKKIFYDFEVFMYDWLVVFIDYDTREKTVIVNDPIALRQMYEKHKDDIFCGYNSRTYDQVIFKAILCALNPYEVNNQIISENKKEYQILGRKNKIPFNNYDCLLLNKSLKQLEGFLNSKIKESDIPFTINRKLTKDEIEETILYCTHDVEQTIVVFENTKEEFDAQLGLIESFELPMSSFGKTKAQLVAEILGAKRREGMNDEFNLSFPDTLVLSEKYQYIADWYKEPKNQNYSRKLKCEVAGCEHIFGYGGIHGALPNIEEEGIILSADVASLYPSLIIEYGYMSRGVDSVEKYKQIRDTRLVLKKQKDPKQLPLKIVLNSCYGTFKDQYNPLYDPLQSNNVCLAGQLLLVDLIEKIEPYCKLLQSNTDGVFLLVKDRETVNKIKEVASEWEKRTRLDLEWDEYTKLVQKDVNNYVLIDKEGKYKSKGAYLKKLSPIDSDLLIINKALIDYFTKGIQVEDTIKNSTKLSDFQKIIKISSLYLHALVNGEEVKEKVLRVFASKLENATGVVKVKDVDGELRFEKVANTPEKCFINNENISNESLPDYLDLDYYIEMAKSRVKDFLDGSKVSKAKPKSEIKGINEDVYNAILDIDLESFSNFTDVLIYLKSHNVCTKTVVAILIKLDYFRMFYGGVKLLKLWEEFYNNVKFSPSQSEKTRNEKIEHMRKWENVLKNSDFTFKEKMNFRKQFLGTFITNKDEDRTALLVTDVFEAKRKSDGKRFGYNITTESVGSGVKSRFTIMNIFYKKHGEIKPNDVIRCLKYTNSNGFFNLENYKQIF